MIREVTHREAAQLCELPTEDYVRRFAHTVLDHRDARLLGPSDLILLYVDKWLQHVAPELDMVQRFQLCKEMHDEGQLGGYVIGAIEHADPNNSIPGFFVSLYDKQWASWTYGPGVLSLQTFTWRKELPKHHIYTFILSVTPLYFLLERNLERMDAISQQSTGP